MGLMGRVSNGTTKLSLRPVRHVHTLARGCAALNRGGLAWHTEHNNYVPLHINLLVSYISGMKSRPVLPHLTQVYLTKHITPNRALCPLFYSFPKDLLASLFI